VGAVQRLATVVVIGLVALATILVLYLADEPSRLKAEEEEQQEAAIERGIQTYITYCLACHGPAGEGLMGPDAAGTGRIGLPLGGDTYATNLNQHAIDAQGTPVSGGVEARATVLHDTIVNGRGNMPAWGAELNEEQIFELVTLIQHVDWNLVYNEAIDAAGGYPTPPPAAGQPKGETASEGQPADTGGGGGGEAAAGVTIILGKPVEMSFDPSELEIPANTDVTVTLTNEGAAPHNFSIDDLGISVDVQPGETQTTTINAAPGDYEFHCNIPGHKEAGMHGVLHVVEGGGGDAASGQAAPEGEAPAEGDQAAAEATVTMGQPAEMAFDPSDLTIPANTDVTLTIPNAGAAPHNFSVDDLGISVDVNPGETGTVTINAAPGEYEFHCNVPGHKEAGMTGTLVVE
jgi:uncharacterized cupredoxin-like copper-binding protein/mono/diheme cytochrome c family protein